MIGQFREIHLVERAEHLILSVESIPQAERKHFLRIANRHGMRLEPWQQVRPTQSPASGEFAKALSVRLESAYAMQALDTGQLNCHRPDSRWSLAKPPVMVCDRVLLRLHDQRMMMLTILPPSNSMPPLEVCVQLPRLA